MKKKQGDVMKRNTWLSAVFAVFAAFAADAEVFGKKAVQLDLARQIETVPFVKDFLRRSRFARSETVRTRIYGDARPRARAVTGVSKPQAKGIVSCEKR